MAKKEFSSIVKNLHHLSSTRHIPGIFNSPFAKMKPKAFDIPLEVHLKSSFRAHYKWKPPNRKAIFSFR